MRSGAGSLRALLPCLPPRLHSGSTQRHCGGLSGQKRPVVRPITSGSGLRITANSQSTGYMGALDRCRPALLTAGLAVPPPGALASPRRGRSFRGRRRPAACHRTDCAGDRTVNGTCGAGAREDSGGSSDSNQRAAPAIADAAGYQGVPRCSANAARVPGGSAWRGRQRTGDRPWQTQQPWSRRQYGRCGQ